MRTTTERPITVSEGTNHLAGTDPDAVVAAVEAALDAPRTSHRPPLWDGATAPRIVDVLLSRIAGSDLARRRA